MCIRPVFSRVDKKRGTYRVKESVHLNRPTVEPNRIRKQNGRRGSRNGENSDQPEAGSNAWAAKRISTQVLQLSEFIYHPATVSLCVTYLRYCDFTVRQLLSVFLSLIICSVLVDCEKI